MKSIRYLYKNNECTVAKKLDEFGIKYAYQYKDKWLIDNYKIQYIRDKKKYEICKNIGIKIFYYSNFANIEYFSEIYNNIDKMIKIIIK